MVEKIFITILRFWKVQGKALLEVTHLLDERRDGAKKGMAGLHRPF